MVALAAQQTARKTEPRGRYELGAEIARGGMGIVFRAFDRLAQREVAYKRLHVENDTHRARCAALFEREYAVLARLSHPNIVQVYEYGIEAGDAFYTMELLAGQGLRDAVPLPLRDTCAALRDVASALSLVHARRFVHRDISPANVRLCPDGRAKLLDFGGLATFGAAPDIVGTPAFIAPECLTTKQLDARTDLYSLGAVAYWALTKRTPFPASTFEARLRAASPVVVPPSQYVSELPPALDELLLSLLQTDPRARPGSAAEVMERLTAIAGLPDLPNERQVAFSFVTHPPLVGREAQRTRAQTLLQEASLGRALVCAVQGEAGSGRTALLDQIAIDAQLLGCSVLRAQGRGPGRAFGVAQRLVRTGVAIHPEVDAPRVGSVWPLDSGNAKVGPAVSPVDAVQRHERAVNAWQTALINFAQRGPLVLLIDDAQHVDPESLAVLASLSHTAQNSPLLIVVAVTHGADSEPNPVLSRLLRSADVIALPALSPDHMRDMVDSIFGTAPNARRLAGWLHERSQGRPSACVNLLHLLLQRDVIHYLRGTFSLPHDLDPEVIADDEAQLQIARLSHLSDTARLLAHVLSIQDIAVS